MHCCSPPSCLALLAGKTWHTRLNYSMFAFGVWDVFYYIFLIPMSGWPRSVLDWDVLFLVPLPWWGPVLAPVLISTLLIIGGVMITQGERPDRPLWPIGWAWILNWAGVGIALYTFLENALRALGGGETAIRKALPTSFSWPLFGVALVLLAAPIADMGRQLWQHRSKGR